MEKRQVLFVNDKDLSLDLKKGFLDKNRYELETVSEYEAGLEALSVKNFGLVICGLKAVTLQADLLSAVKKRSLFIKTISIASSALDEFLIKIVHEGLSFDIIGGSPPLNLEEISITVEKLFSKDIFGIDRYLPGGAKSVELKINDSTKKSNYIDQVINFVRTFDRNQRRLRTISEIVDELLMNAIYDAPCNAKGEPLYYHIDRTEKVVLKDEEAASLKCAYDGRYLIISVSDPFGSLNKDKLIGRLIKCGTKDGVRVEIKPGGGGVGLHNILEYVNSFVINLTPKKKTEIICIIDFKRPMREFQKTFKSFHIFMSKEEIRMAEKLTITREDLDDVLSLTFEGIIDENTFLGRIFETDKRKIKINIRGVDRINSCGVREWVNAIKEIPPKKQLEFLECSLPMVKQFNMITNFEGHGKVVSFMAPYFCSQCNKQFENLIVLNKHFEEILNLKAPSFSCPECRGKLEFDDLEDKYFQFAIRQESKL